jgi:prepilin-type N-terminal cleavage/methylation domain-containing protein
MKKQLSQHGYTLVEIAMVVVIVGLLIGGILRGQELINSAKARNIIDQKTSIQTAIVAFSNRYKATPGDLTAAQANFIAVPNTALPSKGGGNGVVTLAAGATNESVLVFQNLAATSFLSCMACMTVVGNGNVASDVTNSPVNVSGLYLQYGSAPSSALGVSWLDNAAPALPARNILTTGSLISSGILKEVDVKADDGAPHTGLFRQSSVGGADTTANCAPATAGMNNWVTPDNAGCAGAWLF